VNINKKIIGLLVLSFFSVSAIFTFNSISALKKNQADNIALFKAEFLELGRELFADNSTLFFNNLDTEIKNTGKDQTTDQAVLNFIKKVDAQGEDVVIFDISSKQYLAGYGNPDVTNIFSQSVMQTLIEKYLQENTLNQKTDFDLDNFSEFNSDTTNTVIPKKVHFRIYNDAGIMVGFGQDFSSGKVRIEFIERQNQALFNSQLYYSVVIFSVILTLIIIFLIILMRKIIIKPLDEIVGVVKVITGGDLTKQVVVKSKDEIGQLGLAFNEMTAKLKESYKIMESKIEDRTKELQIERGSLEKKAEERTSELEGLKTNLEKTIEERTRNLNSKVLELEKMNDLMVGRELKMAELKDELKKLKDKKK